MALNARVTQFFLNVDSVEFAIVFVCTTLNTILTNMVRVSKMEHVTGVNVLVQSLLDEILRFVTGQL